MEDHTLIIMDAKKGSEYSAEALLKANDSQNRLDILEKLVIELRAENKTLKAQYATLAEAGPAPTSFPERAEAAVVALDVLSTRLEAKIDATNEA